MTLSSFLYQCRYILVCIFLNIIYEYKPLLELADIRMDLTVMCYNLREGNPHDVQWIQVYHLKYNDKGYRTGVYW